MKLIRYTWKLPWWSVLSIFSPPLRTRRVGQVLLLYYKVELYLLPIHNNSIYPVAFKDGEGDTVVQGRKQKLNL